MALFDARGFQAVTVAEIAKAAGVSTKTVFNYFPVKEDLVLVGRRRHEDVLLRSIADRQGNEGVLHTVLECTLTVLRELETMPREQRERFRRVLAASPSIGERLRIRTWETERELAALLAEQSNADPCDPRPTFVASILMLLWHLAFWGSGTCIKRQSTELSADAWIRVAANMLAEGLLEYPTGAENSVRDLKL
ncbi:hypothetical protein ASC97_30520 [Rhizobium sp. Root1203]|nr:hypothetical protein ASC97_30520 [Rhizobium sp. Root1203]